MLKIVISPANKMNITDEFPCNATVPVFSDRADVLHGILKNKNIQELKTLWKCSDKLAEQNYQRLHAFSPDQAVTPALLAYEGIQYQHIAPSVFTDAQWHYVNVHLRILSGFYGILKPTDKVIPYRLEMQAKLEAAKKNDLYEYWSDTLYQSLLAEGMTELVNLASAEYSKVILPYKNIRCITCIFGEEVNGKIKVKGTQAKIARGEMVRWMAAQKISYRVYLMTCSIWEDTKYDRETKQCVPIAWYVTWEVRIHSPKQGYGEKIAGQNLKRYTDKNAAIKYLDGRKKAYSHLFTEISPPIPKEYERHFMVHGTLLPGYTVEGLEQTKTEHAAAEVSEGGIFTPQNQEKPSVLGKLSVAKTQEKTPAAPGTAMKKKEDIQL